jgi:hypothetical protein
VEDPEAWKVMFAADLATALGIPQPRVVVREKQIRGFRGLT